jgi:TonB-linked SusC/RagA family outer membrane protein
VVPPVKSLDDQNNKTLTESYSLTQNYCQVMQFSANEKRRLRRLFRNQFFLLMKLTAVLLLAACLQVSASAVSQTVSLKLSNAPLETVLKEVSKQTGYEFFYRLEEMKEARSLSIDVSNFSLKAALDEIFKNQPFAYAIANKTIIISPRPVQLPQSADTTRLPSPPAVKGKVLNENGGPIPGATVTVKGTKRANLTNEHGDVTMEGVPGNVTLVVSSIGFEPQEIRLNGRMEFSVRLKQRISELNVMEVNNGMFTRNKISFTGAVTSYTGDQLKAIGNRNVLESLKTLDPSFVQIVNNNAGSDPNTTPTFEIRGRTSISTTDLNNQFNSDPNQPLFILDGFESTLQAIYDLDMNRVSSVTILKDAASTALYGAKASNGVVIVETKRPVPGELRVSYTGDFSLDMPDLRSYNLMNAAEKLQFEKLSGVYIQPNTQWLSDLQYNQRLASVQSGVNTYWLSEPVHLGVTNRHSVQLSGGNNSLLFNAGASYGNQNGILKGSGRQTWSGNFNTTYRKGKVNITDMLGLSGTTATASPYGDFSAFAQANPYYKKRNADGSLPEFLDLTDTKMANPLYNASLNSLNRNKNFSFYNNLQAIITLSNTVRVQGGFQLSKGNGTQISFLPPENSSFDGVDPHQKGSYSNSHSDNTGYSGNLMLSWAKVVNRSQFNANARAEIQQSSGQSETFSAVGFPYGTDGNPSYAYGYTPYSRPSASTSVSHSVGFLGSFNYAYDQRFLIDGTYRLDGASIFGSNRLFKPFASGGLGWNIYKEHFLRQYRWIDLLKIRGDIGFTGNENLGEFTSVSTYSIQSAQNNFGQGLEMVSLGNPNLAWQKTLQQSYGVDFAFLHNRIGGYAEYFIKRTDPLAIGASGTLPSSVGVNGNYVLNVGNLTTKGWDFNMRVSPIYNLKKRIIWTLGITGSAYTSVYGGLGNSLSAINKALLDSNSLNGLLRYRDGYSPDDTWAVVSKGIDPATGHELFLKKDGTLTFTYDPNDIVRVGNTRPKIEGVINSTFTYKNFTLGANIRYSYGGYIFNSALYNKVENISYANVHYNQDKRALYERWQKPGDISQFKAISENTYTPMSSRFVEKNNYFDGESFSLGYRISNGWIRRMSMQSLSFTGYLNNIFWLESVKTERGINYPFDRTVSFSVNASF